MKNTKTCPRREVHYDSLEMFLGDVDRLVAAGAVTTGNWSMAQIFEHLAIVIDKSVDGYGSPAPWPIRIVGKLLKNRFLTKPMPAGFQLPARAAALLPTEQNLPAAQEHIHSAVGRFRAAARLQPHPVFGPLTRDQWNQLHLRHSELHMSFIANP
jgi:hypothetical protein